MPRLIGYLNLNYIRIKGDQVVISTHRPISPNHATRPIHQVSVVDCSKASVAVVSRYCFFFFFFFFFLFVFLLPLPVSREGCASRLHSFLGNFIYIFAFQWKAVWITIGIKHGFSCINIRQVPWEVLKTEAEGRSFQHLPRDLTNVNALKKHVRSLLLHKKCKHFLHFALLLALFCFAFPPTSREPNFH